PNWWQFVALHLAAARIGAISNPLMPIFRERELLHMLGLAESKVLIIPNRLRNFDHSAMVAGIRDKLPALRHVLDIGGQSATSFEAFIARAWEEEIDMEALFASRRQGPNEVTEILYTSGTTGEPKGVMHIANTLFGNLVQFVKRLNLGEQDVTLMASPLAHQTGFIYGMLLPILVKGKLVLQDTWNPEDAARLIQDEGVTYTMAATPFLSDLSDLPTLKDFDTSSLRIFVCGGASIPAALARRAAERLGARIVSAWGMTENGAVTITRPNDLEDKVFGTDGFALPGLELQVVDADGKVCPHGTEGNLKVRGASNFVGYLKRPQLYGVNADGWFDTGDRAQMDADGYIRITGRSKDIIIRNGENIPVTEVEGLLYGHPSIHEVALIAIPDVRMGERACAFVSLKPDVKPLTLPDIVDFLSQHKMAKQYYPERLEIMPALPRTLSGKIQKFKLREIARQLKVDHAMTKRRTP
ncbi:MAG: AMP-binding protein, partial [Pseudorhodoplanes sp.]|nr:AMP-binding protein [Pseudorhodoplanes sp.]